MSALWPLLRLIGPYLLAAGVAGYGGWRAGWAAQGVNVAAARAELTNYQTEQQRLALIAIRQADERQAKTRTDYARAKRQIAQAGEEMAAYRRCVDAGRCGPAVGLCGDVPAGGAAAGLSATGRTDGAGGGAVPAARIAAPGVIGDCAAVQLQLNQLQADIAAQTGF